MHIIFEFFNSRWDNACCCPTNISKNIILLYGLHGSPYYKLQAYDNTSKYQIWRK